VIGNIGHPSTLRTLPWLPAALWGLEGWRARRAARGLAAGAACVGLMLLAGPPPGSALRARA